MLCEEFSEDAVKSVQTQPFCILSCWQKSSLTAVKYEGGVESIEGFGQEGATQKSSIHREKAGMAE